MDPLIDFLAFRRFVSSYALVFFYYLGAAGIPLASWALVKRASRRLPWLTESAAAGMTVARGISTWRGRLVVAGAVVGAFLLMQLFWRMLFEFLIAFLQMRDALLFLARPA